MEVLCLAMRSKGFVSSEVQYLCCNGEVSCRGVRVVCGRAM